ncbi:MAG TPA: hypothetical protein VGA61_03785, partial [Anaerolineae bacterium]
PASVAGAIKTVQTFTNGLRFGTFDMPALVAVALLGIILNLILNWGQIVSEVRAPVPADEAHATALP